MIGRTYSIIRSRREANRTINVVMATGLSWEDADTRRDGIAADYRAANPNKSSWSGDVFIVEMEPLHPDPQQELFHA